VGIVFRARALSVELSIRCSAPARRVPCPSSVQVCKANAVANLICGIEASGHILTPPDVAEMICIACALLPKIKTDRTISSYRDEIYVDIGICGTVRNTSDHNHSFGHA